MQGLIFESKQPLLAPADGFVVARAYGGAAQSQEWQSSHQPGADVYLAWYVFTVTFNGEGFTKAAANEPRDEFVTVVRFGGAQFVAYLAGFHTPVVKTLCQ